MWQVYTRPNSASDFFLKENALLTVVRICILIRYMYFNKIVKIHKFAKKIFFKLKIFLKKSDALVGRVNTFIILQTK
jgi:hypothetical protein